MCHLSRFSSHIPVPCEGMSMCQLLSGGATKQCQSHTVPLPSSVPTGPGLRFSEHHPTPGPPGPYQHVPISLGLPGQAHTHPLLIPVFPTRLPTGCASILSWREKRRVRHRWIKDAHRFAKDDPLPQRLPQDINHSATNCTMCVSEQDFL